MIVKFGIFLIVFGLVVHGISALFMLQHWVGGAFLRTSVIIMELAGLLLIIIRALKIRRSRLS